MKSVFVRKVVQTLTLSAVLASPLWNVSSAHAEQDDYPHRTATIVVPWPPGGPSDMSARPMSKGLSDILGQSFVIDNRAGAGGNIGSALVVKAKPDGYTLLATSSAPISINRHVYKNIGFDPEKDLAPITNLLRVPIVLVANPRIVKAKDLKGLLAEIGNAKGNFQYASSGNGTPQHLTGELFRSETRADMVHVPYKGSAPAITDLLGGQVPIMFDSTVAIVPHIRSGAVRAIAVAGDKRSPLLPDVPTFAELGYKDIVSFAWYGFFAPAKTPDAVIDKLNSAALEVMKTPEYQQLLKDTGSEYPGSTPKEFAEFVRKDSARWGQVARRSGARID